jgi:hypothetical protein
VPTSNTFPISPYIQLQKSQNKGSQAQLAVITGIALDHNFFRVENLPMGPNPNPNPKPKMKDRKRERKQSELERKAKACERKEQKKKELWKKEFVIHQKPIFLLD